MKFLLRWLLSAVALMIISYFVQGVAVHGLYAALIASLVLGLVNALIRPIMVALTLPINIVTLGLFTLVINALMFWLTATVVQGFYVIGFWPAFWGALMMSVAGWAINYLIKK